MFGIYLFVYFKGKYLIPPLWGQCASMPRKQRRRKDKWEERRNRKGSRQRTQPPTLTWANDVLIGDGEQNGKQKKEEKKRNSNLDPRPATMELPLKTCINHKVGLFSTPLPTCPEKKKREMKIKIKDIMTSFQNVFRERIKIKPLNKKKLCIFSLNIYKILNNLFLSFICDLNWHI